ncbi:hypothetical protein Vafri_6095 [Volvox africanus]|uniref:PHD-type domain-containing protein n=1 Tax=Volvox africanus TaxID=51714 RepID=A0A8J4AY07_9CHLO|nr:hypothetical protein Vafri_6095 [Volvox africanus]
MPRARARQAGLALVSDLSEESFSKFLLKVSRKPKGGIDGIGDLTRQQLLGVCGALESHVAKVLPVATMELEESTPPSEEAILTLHGAAALALELLTHSQPPPPEQLLNAAVMLHDGILISKLDPDPKLYKLQVEMQDAVMRLCCAWWERQLPGNDFLVARTIPYVLLRTMQDVEATRTSMVHLCYVIRDSLELLDFEDETIWDTKRMLLFAAMHPAFLREAEGRRFIAGLFKLEPQMTRELCAIVRNQIPSGQRFALEAYGEILFRAWRDTVGPCAAEVESELQALMQAAILASTPALATALRVVLDGLHNQRDLEKRVSPALVRLYDPILPRAFGAANAEVRRNAVSLLAAAFPIIDPEAPPAENNTRLTQQLGFLLESIVDPCAGVREAAVEGCCRCLRYFWEIIPAATSAKMICDMTGKLAFDKSSRAVRIAVLRGLHKLVDKQHAQPVLKKALPNILGLLQDPDPGVREALADMLTALSATRSLNFWGVVPPEELLEVIAVEKNPAVTRKISKMLVPSYFPNAQEGSARLGALLRSKPEAGLAFCRNMVARFYPSEPEARRGKKKSSMEFTASVPVEQILKFASELLAHLLATVPRVASPVGRPTKQSRRGNAAAGGCGKAGKKRSKKKSPAPPSVSEEDGVAGDQQAVVNADAANKVTERGVQAEDDEDIVLDQSLTSETEEGWLAILEGLAVVADGLGAAEAHTGECSKQELEAAFPASSITQLLQAAEDQLCKPKAVKLVLEIVASLHSIAGALSVRATLFSRLAEGVLPGGKVAPGDDEAMELDGHRGPQGNDVGVLSQMLKTLATGSNSNKLVAMLSAALGIRQPLPLRKPAASKENGRAYGAKGPGHDVLEQILGKNNGSRRSVGLDGHGRGGDDCEDDDVDLCLGCKRSEPVDTLLLCDGCDAPYHTHCLRPALREVPEGAWFCWACESQLQSVRLSPAAAGRCVCLLLQHEEGRQAIFDHPDFNAMIQAMQQLALAEADEIVRLAQGGPADEAESLGTRPAKGNEAAEVDCAAMLGDPWGALSRYCRAALHRAMAALFHQSATGNDEPSVLPTPRRTPASSGRNRRSRRVTASESGGEEPAPAPSADEAKRGTDAQEAAGQHEAAALMGFFEVVPVLELALQTCGHLTELVHAESYPPAHLAALQYSQGLLRVLHVVHQTELLNMSGRYVSTVACLCNAQAVLTHTVISGLAEQGGPSVDQQACVSVTLQVLLGLAQQMNEAVRSCALTDGGGGPSVVGGDGGGGSQSPANQLEARMNAEAAAVQEGSSSEATGADSAEQAQELPPPGAAVEALVATLLALLCHTAVEPLLKGSVRAATAVLLSELLAGTQQVTMSSWLGTLCQLAGQALATDPRVAGELQEVLRAEGAGAAAGGENGCAATAEDNAAGVNGEVDGAARAVRRRVQNSQKTVAKDAAKALQTAAAKVSELLQRESPAVGTLATVLVRVCTARQVLGHAILLLARLASKALVSAATPLQSEAAWEEHPDGIQTYGDVALGATALFMMCQAACPEFGAAAAPRNQQANASGRRGALAKQAAAQAARAESEAAAKALDVLRRAVQQSQEQQKDYADGTGDNIGESAERSAGLLQARLLAQQLVSGFGKAAAAGQA